MFAALKRVEKDNDHNFYFPGEEILVNVRHVVCVEQVKLEGPNKRPLDAIMLTTTAGGNLVAGTMSEFLLAAS